MGARKESVGLSPDEPVRARKGTVVGHAKLESLLPVPQEDPPSGVRLLPPEARAPRAEPKAAVRFVPRRTLPTLPGGAEAHPSSVPPPTPAPATVSEAAPAKKSTPPPPPMNRRAAVRQRAPRPDSAPPPPVKSLIATAVDWPRIKAQPFELSRASEPAAEAPAAPKVEELEIEAPIIEEEQIEVAIAIPEPAPSGAEIPPSVIDVAPASASMALAGPSTDIVIDDDQDLRAMRGSRKGLLLALCVAVVGIATALVVTFAH